MGGFLLSSVAFCFPLNCCVRPVHEEREGLGTIMVEWNSWMMRLSIDGGVLIVLRPSAFNLEPSGLYVGTRSFCTR